MINRLYSIRVKVGNLYPLADYDHQWQFALQADDEHDARRIMDNLTKSIDLSTRKLTAELASHLVKAKPESLKVSVQFTEVANV